MLSRTWAPVLDVGFDQRVPVHRLLLFGTQHLVTLSAIWVFPVLIGVTLGLGGDDVSHLIQASFLLAGIVTVVQSSRVVRLPIVQGPTAAFFAALLAAGATYGLGAAFGSMVVAGLIFMLLSLPIGRLGVLTHVVRFAAEPLVYGTLCLIIGAQLATLGLPNWFGAEGEPAYGWKLFGIGLATLLVVVACLLFGGDTIVKRAAVLIGMLAGTLLALAFGLWSPPALGGTVLVGPPAWLPFGFDVRWPAVLLMLLAFLESSAEAVGMYALVSRWGGVTLTRTRITRGLFTEYAGTVAGALFGGVGTATYPENAGIVRVSRIGSRYVTMTAGLIAIALAFVPVLATFVAGLPGAVLAAASTVLFGIIALSGVQMMSGVEWDDLNLTVAATAFILALGGQWLPESMVATMPDWVRAVVTTPMMFGAVLLIVLNALINHGLRRVLGR
ncbi:uracil-xanthine permease family protein [Actinoplanes couchii]|uniref:Uric acid permease n=1 Tax=Actinoplanes couchii TaxID=403638 RepID=A0ABQ3XSL8_9ACTN|nr:solute carrier family 23 protein [Actinoplanes couchii]MDR6318566.1 uracil-xanthine permease [Actinoplanes couchii]GID61501.1 uric acid permease [Actinoplanes couchii]